MKRAFILGVCMLIFTGCASVPVTVAQAELSGIIDSGILDAGHIVTVEEKARLRVAMTHARDNIGAAEERRAEAEKKAESSAAWATRGKWLFGILVGVVVLAVLGSIAAFIRKFSFFG